MPEDFWSSGFAAYWLFLGAASTLIEDVRWKLKLANDAAQNGLSDVLTLVPWQRARALLPSDIRVKEHLVRALPLLLPKLKQWIVFMEDLEDLLRLLGIRHKQVPCGSVSALRSPGWRTQGTQRRCHCDYRSAAQPAGVAPRFSQAYEGHSLE